MAENTRQSEVAGLAAAPCASAAGAHIERGAQGGSRAAGVIDGRKPSRGHIRAGAGRETIWGGDRDDPRLFYFRALLASDRFFGGVKRA